MKVTHRLTCRLCDGKNLDLVIPLNPIPLSELYTAQPEEHARFPIDIYMCRTCGHVQQLDVPDRLWDSYSYQTGKAPGMAEHFEVVAGQLLKELPPNSLVIDVGSNDGSLLKPLKAAGHRVLGIDPAKEIAAQATAEGIETIPQVLTQDLAHKIRAKYGPAKIVTAFNAFAHADDLHGMTQAILTLMDTSSLFVFEVQYLLDVIDKMLIGTFFHEHMSHHAVTPLARFLASNYLELIHVERIPFIQHGSIIGTAQTASGERVIHPSVPKILQLEQARELTSPKTLVEFNERIQTLRAEIKSFPWSGMVAAYGAARSGPTLIAQLGLKPLIECIFDDHPQKVGKFSPDGIPILPTSELLARMPAYTLILAWVHADTIIRQNREYLECGGRFVVLTPELKVIGRDVERAAA